MARLILVRHGEPPTLDKAPYGTICKIRKSHTMFLQVSRDEHHPNWENLEVQEPYSIKEIEEAINKRLNGM